MSLVSQRTIISKHMWAKLILTNQEREVYLHGRTKEKQDMGCNAMWPVAFSSIGDHQQVT